MNFKCQNCGSDDLTLLNFVQNVEIRWPRWILLHIYFMRGFEYSAFLYSTNIEKQVAKHGFKKAKCWCWRERSYHSNIYERNWMALVIWSLWIQRSKDALHHASRCLNGHISNDGNARLIDNHVLKQPGPFSCSRIAVVTSSSSASTFRLFKSMPCNLFFNVRRDISVLYIHTYTHKHIP